MSQERDAILAADVNPCDFLLPYIKQHLREAASWQDTVDFRKLRHGGFRELEWQECMRRCQSLEYPMESIAAYLQRYHQDSGKPRSGMYETLSDFDILIAKVKKRILLLDKLIQHQANEQTSLEARKSLHQEDAVRR